MLLGTLGYADSFRDIVKKLYVPIMIGLKTNRSMSLRSTVGH